MLERSQLARSSYRSRLGTWIQARYRAFVMVGSGYLEFFMLERSQLACSLLLLLLLPPLPTHRTRQHRACVLRQRVVSTETAYGEY
eukprot:3291545-Rhodomonas_salina.1